MQIYNRLNYERIVFGEYLLKVCHINKMSNIYQNSRTWLSMTIWVAWLDVASWATSLMSIGFFSCEQKPDKKEVLTSFGHYYNFSWWNIKRNLIQRTDNVFSREWYSNQNPCEWIIEMILSEYCISIFPINSIPILWAVNHKKHL